MKEEKGAFLICVDLELAWGWAFNGSFLKHQEQLNCGRQALLKLMDMLDQYRVPVTWATVGHLFLECCQASSGKPHSDLLRPQYHWLAGDWYRYDPCTDLKSDPIWYAKDIVEAIQKRVVQHEIASHSFGHLLFSESGCTEEVAASDLGAAISAALRCGVALRSFVYPQHKCAYTELLSRYGFTAFRGELRESFLKYPGLLRKVLKLLVFWLSIPPSPQEAEQTSAGLIHLPASMHFGLPGTLWGRVITASHLAGRCKGGIRQAIRKGKMFQIYFHDHNMGLRTEEFFEALEGVLAFADDQRRKGNLEIMTMADYVTLLKDRIARPAS